VSSRRINQLSVLLLFLGLGSAFVIYLRATPVTLDPLIGNPLHSKKYMHELRVMGGHANVALAEFQAWFAERWEGENLAVTVAVLTLAVVPLFRFVARHPELFNPHGIESPAAPEPPPTPAPRPHQ
jgi:hypothetical protein